MQFQIKLERNAEKQLANIPEIYRYKILAILPSIAKDPFSGKKLKGKLQNMYSVRVWPYRIIYNVYKKVLAVVVIEVQHRKDVYK